MSKGELEKAVQAVVPTYLQQKILELLVQQPQTVFELTARLGLKAMVQVNGAFGRYGHAVSRQLSAHPDGVPDGEYQWWSVVAIGERRQGRWLWTLRPEVKRALRGMAVGIPSLPEEVAGPYVEGATTQVLVNIHERDPAARDACIAAHGAQCAACGVDLGEVYGEVARGFIHVHHLTPLSSRNGPHVVDPVADMRPVCPTCHAVAHLKSPPHTIEELKAMLRRSSRGRRTTGCN